MEENFENMTLGASFETGRPGWLAYSASYGTSTAQNIAGSLMGRVYASGYNYYYMRYAFSTAGTYTSGVKIDFDMAAGATNMYRQVMICPNSSSDYWYIAFGSTGNIVARHVSSEIVLRTYTANTRYHVTLEFVGNMHTIDITINGTKYTNGGAHFSTAYSTASMIQWFYVHCRDSGAGWIAVDNIDASWSIRSYPDEPSITHPSDITYTMGQTGYQISWTITDANASTKTYMTYANGSSIASGSWISGVAVTQNVTGLPIGSYNYTIVANDGLGHSAQDTVIINVLANQAPTITHPADIMYTGGQTGNYIYWTITDAGTTTRTYTIYVNGSSLTSGSWTSGTTIMRSVDGLSVGSYNYTIVVNDGLGLSAQDEVIVRVLNGIPTITHPYDIIYTCGYTGHTIWWTVYDSSTITRTYTIYVNGSSLTTGTWTTGNSFSRSVDGLAIGFYNYTIVATDGYGGTVQDTVIVQVLNGIPWITQPYDTTYTWDQTGVAVSWTITDLSATTPVYTIYADGHVIATGTWDSGVAVTLNLDGIAPGTYNFTIVVIDGFGARVQDQMWLIRLDEQTTSPLQEAGPGIALVILGILGASLILMLVVGAVVSSKLGIGKPQMTRRKPEEEGIISP